MYIYIYMYINILITYFSPIGTCFYPMGPSQGPRAVQGGAGRPGLLSVESYGWSRVGIVPRRLVNHGREEWSTMDDLGMSQNLGTLVNPK